MQVAPSRTIDGVVRITVESHCNIHPSKLDIQLRGGSRSESGGFGTILQLTVWRPRTQDEYDLGMMPGR
jgi:hypothetical protein